MGENYATNLSDAQSEVQAFIDEASALAAQFFIYFDQIKTACDDLLQLGGGFLSSNDLTCRSSFLRLIGKGCDAELSARRCELTGFLNEITKRRDEALAFINAVECKLRDLGNLVQSFTSTNILKPGCGCNAPDYCQVRAAINNFFAEFNRIHWLGHIEFIKLQIVCDDVTKKTSSFYVKYSCL